MSWHYSQALEEAFSAACSSAGAPSVPWRSMPSAPDDSCSDKMKGTCHRSLFGTMFVPSTHARGEALLTWFREAFLVKTSASQTPTVSESTVRKAGSGKNSRASFARFDLATFSWRTAQLSLFGALVECLETWPRWGSMRGGECFPLKPLVHGTGGRGSGSLPTLTANDNKPASRVEVTEYRQKKRRTTGQRLRAAVTEPDQLGGTLNPDWCEWFMGWPIGWTASEPLETDRFQQWLLGHGKRLED